MRSDRVPRRDQSRDASSMSNMIPLGRRSSAVVLITPLPGGEGDLREGLQRLSEGP